MSDKKENFDQFGDELAVSVSEPRNWKGILIALLVIASICSLIFLAIVLLSPHLSGKVKNERLKLEDVLDSNKPWKMMNETWLSETELLYLNSDSSLMVYDLESKWESILASNQSLSHVQVQKYSVSADRKYVLLAYALKPRNSFSFRAKYKVYNTANAQITQLKVKNMANENEVVDEFDHVEFGPRGNQLILVYGNNMYYLPQVDGESVQRQITRNGLANLVYNGVPDLLYEEFVLKRGSSFWWQAKGDRICYLSIDNSKVPTMSVVRYTNTDPSPAYGRSHAFAAHSIRSANNQVNSSTSTSGLHDDNGFSSAYPHVIAYPYPKPGSNNPTVSVWIAEVTSSVTRNHRRVTPPKELHRTEFYVNSVNWVDEDRVSIIWTNRAQNYSLITLCVETNDWICEKLTDEQNNKGWIERIDQPLFSSDRQHFFTRLPVQDGSHGAFMHVAILTVQGNQRHFLTHGQYVVTRILAHRPDLNKVYFVATQRAQPDVRHVYSVTDMRAAQPRKLRCLTCHLLELCSYYDVQFSPNASHFLLHCAGPGSRRTLLMRTEPLTIVQTLNHDYRFRDQQRRVAMPQMRFLDLVLPTLQTTARLKMLLPPALDPQEPIRYPAVLRLTNEPEAQSVDRQNHLDWGDYLASKKDYVVIYIDVRGSGGQGRKHEQSIYRQLGELESEDLIHVINHVKENFQYIDPDKIAVWGKGFGGYLVTSLMERDPTFNCGIAVSPIITWKNYMSAFVERYMGTGWPRDSYMNYDKSDLLANVHRLKDKEFLLVHGTADQKVNVQHSMLLMKAMTEANIPFRLQLYPDGDHSLLDEQLHLYKTMEEFFAKCFQLEDEQNEDIIELPITRVIKGGRRIITNDD